MYYLLVFHLPSKLQDQRLHHLHNIRLLTLYNIKQMDLVSLFIHTDRFI
jgi:hypothetical protein